MKNTINYLRTYRKNTSITQFDIAILMKWTDNSFVSRCEKGERSPTLEMILVYHLLFDIPVLKLCSNTVDMVKAKLLRDIPRLISQIECEASTPITHSRLQFLNEAIIRLAKKESYEK